MSKFISLSGLKTLLEPLLHLINKKAESWDDLKNKPFYETKKEIVLIDQEISSPEANLAAPLVEGETYTIIWDGVEYSSIARNYDGYIMLGNNALYEYDSGDSTDTGEPFALETQGGGTSVYFYISEDDTSATHTVKILGNKVVIKKIDEKYLPEMAQDAITDISADGTTVNYTRGDGSSGSFFTQDTTYSNATTNSSGLMSTVDKMKVNRLNVAYGTCNTDGSNASKLIVVDGNMYWNLTQGSLITVKFSNTNTASNPTFNVNNTGARRVYCGTSQITTDNLKYAGIANKPLTYMYDGSQYVLITAGTEGLAINKQNVTISVPTTGWRFDSTYNAYTQSFTASGITLNMDLYVDCEVGANFPIIGARCLTGGHVTLYMSDVPTIAQDISLKGVEEG